MRTLNARTLEGAAKVYVGHFSLPTVYSKAQPDLPVGGQGWVLRNIHNMTFKDEHEFVLARMRRRFGPDALEEFEKEMGHLLEPRSDEVFCDLLADKLAITYEGEHMAGKIGTTQVGTRPLGKHVIEVETPDSLRYRRMHSLGKEHRRTYHKIVPEYWPIYAGEEEERAAGNKMLDEIPPPRIFGGALVTNISAESAVAGLDAILELLNEGSDTGILQGYSGAQPADPDAGNAGTLLFTCVLTDPAFNGAADQSDGTIDAAADTITADASADNTDTVLYCRGAASDNGSTSLDDHIDGEAGTSSADFNFNSVAITAGSTVDVTAWVITMDQGASAT